MAQTQSTFDPIAPLYHRLWNNWYLPAALPALEQCLFSQLAPPASILDVCCGSGHVTRELARRGYTVTGVDLSRGLIEIARQELPQVNFHVQDVRNLNLHGRFHAALSTFDSLNHILSLDGLKSVFSRVFEHLLPCGIFVFDMNLIEAFRADLRPWVVETDDQGVSLIRGLFDDTRQIARTELIWFQRDSNDPETWRRSTSAIEERCYTEEEIVQSLRHARFATIECMPAAVAGMHQNLGFGRLFVRATKPPI